MKYLTLLALVISGLTSHADLVQCSKDLFEDHEMSQAIEYLRSLPSQFEVGGCQIELTVCGQDASEDTDNTVVGDMMITDKHGETFYMLIDFGKRTKKTYRKLEAGKRRMHYDSIERIVDPVNGRSENYRFDILKSKDLASVKLLELGVYTSTLKKTYQGLPPEKSYWVICKEE
jgi:hypothetical protein